MSKQSKQSKGRIKIKEDTLVIFGELPYTKQDVQEELPELDGFREHLRDQRSQVEGFNFGDY